jgi:chemotaxis protein histidine kinase CheA
MKLTIKNYKEATKNVDFSKLPEAAQEAHKEFDSFVEFYNDDKDIKDMLDNPFKIVEPYLTDDSKKGADKSKPQTQRKKTATTQSKKKSSSGKAPRKPKQAKRKPIEVELIPLEIKIIKRYLNLNGKKVTERQVSLLYKVIQKAATEKTIRLTSKYADQIKKIGNDLAQTYKDMGDTCTFDVPEALYSKLKAIVDDYGVTPAIALIKRFINLYGNITTEKAQRLLTSIKNAMKNGKVAKSDSAYERVVQVKKHLEDYLESDKLLVTNVQLNGLKGVAGVGK